MTSRTHTIRHAGYRDAFLDLEEVVGIEALYKMEDLDVNEHQSWVTAIKERLKELI